MLSVVGSKSSNWYVAMDFMKSCIYEMFFQKPFISVRITVLSGEVDKPQKMTLLLIIFNFAL